MNQSDFRPVKYIKLTFWTSFLWKINIQLAEKWPEIVIKWALVIVIRFDSEYTTISIQILFSDSNIMLTIRTVRLNLGHYVTKYYCYLHYFVFYKIIQKFSFKEIKFLSYCAHWNKSNYKGASVTYFLLWNCKLDGQILDFG